VAAGAGDRIPRLKAVLPPGKGAQCHPVARQVGAFLVVHPGDRPFLLLDHPHGAGLADLHAVALQRVSISSLGLAQVRPGVVDLLVLAPVQQAVAFLVDDEEGIKRAFITNFHIPEQLAHYLYTWYSKRWGIETGYRVKKYSFRSKTTSKNYFIRLFYFLFSVLLYNLWILIDILVCLSILGYFNGDHLITSKYFGNLLLVIDPGG